VKKEALQTLLTVTIGTALITAAMTFTHHTPHQTPDPPTQPDPQEMTELFMPDTRTDQEGLVCVPFLNRLHLGGCPMVIV
jgi:hypothetical protein